MMHSYRDERALESRVAELAGYALGLFLLVYLPTAAVIEGLDHDFRRGDALLVAFWVCVGLVGARTLYRHFYYGRCVQIRLHDDGRCELEARRRLIRLHANEITSVKYELDDESDRESYTIRYHGGKLDVSDGMTNFPDFLARLERLNPAVDLSSFPSEAWPASDTASHAGALNLFIRSALFPLLVILAFAWLAIQASTGN
jgi:hypothetical protein